MKTIHIIYHTDVWQSCNSYRTVGVASTLNKAIALAKKDKDAVSDVETEHGCIVINEVTLNLLDSEKQVFCTTEDNCRSKITKKPRP